MKDSELEQLIEADHRATDAFCQGDPEPKKPLYSRRDDVTLANPLGPPARGWDQVSAVLDRAAGVLRDGEQVTFERISAFETPDLACIVEIERSNVKVGGAEERSRVELRATTVFRREAGSWRIVHRHADTVTQHRAPESMITD